MGGRRPSPPPPPPAPEPTVDPKTEAREARLRQMRENTRR